MKIIFIRHGKTAGNLEKRYIGTTDEGLCDEGKSEIKGRAYPDVRRVICSPMKRCIETAALIYPDIKPFICNDLRECDFGDFENKNYSELNGNADYQRWIDSGGEMPFPNGEGHADFTRRCVNAFDKLICDDISEDAAFVVHGGTIMAILEKYAVPRGTFYDFQVMNGSGYITEFDGKNLLIGEKL